ncbi:MAG: hypothetical protein RML94_05635 [Bacteroidia bacterium]|nr:hypothetical protein [Bacteroidia bacterium]
MKIFWACPFAALGSGYYACASVLRYRFALPNGMLRIPHASSLWMFYLVFIHIFALPFLSSLSNTYKVKFFTLFELCLFYLILH